MRYPKPEIVQTPRVPLDAPQTAWDLIGFDGPGWVRLVGGRALYENVDFTDNGRQQKVRLGRLDTAEGLHPVYRYIDADTLLEHVPEPLDDTPSAYEAAMQKECER